MPCKVGPVLHDASAQQLLLRSEVNCSEWEDKGSGPRLLMQLPTYAPQSPFLLQPDPELQVSFPSSFLFFLPFLSFLLLPASLPPCACARACAWEEGWIGGWCQMSSMTPNLNLLRQCLSLNSILLHWLGWLANKHQGCLLSVRNSTHHG